MKTITTLAQGVLPKLDEDTIEKALAGQADMHSFQPIRSIPCSHCLFTIGLEAEAAVVVLVDPPSNPGISVTDHLEFIATALAAQHLPHVAPCTIRWYQLGKDALGAMLLQRVTMATPTASTPRYSAPRWQNLRGLLRSRGERSRVVSTVATPVTPSLPRLKRIFRARGEGGIDYCVLFLYQFNNCQEHGVLLAHGMPEQVTEDVIQQLERQVVSIVHNQVDPSATVRITGISTHAGANGRRQLPLIA